MSRNQEMSVGGAREYIASQTITVMSESGKGFNRALTYTVGGDLYRVIDHGDVIYSGTSTGEALDAYYDIVAR